MPLLLRAIFERGIVHNCHALGRLEVEFRLLNGHVFAPVAEAEFRLDVPRLPDGDACELIARIHFEKHFVECIPVFLSRLANQDSVPSFGRSFFGIFYRRNRSRPIRGWAPGVGQFQAAA